MAREAVDGKLRRSSYDLILTAHAPTLGVLGPPIGSSVPAEDHIWSSVGVLDARGRRGVWAEGDLLLDVDHTRCVLGRSDTLRGKAHAAYQPNPLWLIDLLAHVSQMEGAAWTHDGQITLPPLPLRTAPRSGRPRRWGGLRGRNPLRFRVTPCAAPEVGVLELESGIELLRLAIGAPIPDAERPSRWEQRVLLSFPF